MVEGLATAQGVFSERMCCWEWTDMPTALKQHHVSHSHAGNDLTASGVAFSVTTLCTQLRAQSSQSIAVASSPDFCWLMVGMSGDGCCTSLESVEAQEWLPAGEKKLHQRE